MDRNGKGVDLLVIYLKALSGEVAETASSRGLWLRWGGIPSVPSSADALAICWRLLSGISLDVMSLLLPLEV